MRPWRCPPARPPRRSSTPSRRSSRSTCRWRRRTAAWWPPTSRPSTTSRSSPRRRSTASPLALPTSSPPHRRRPPRSAWSAGRGEVARRRSRWDGARRSGSWPARRCRPAAAELGLLATAGYGSVPAFPRLRIGVLAVGDLVEPGRPSGFGQVRDAVSYLLLGAVRDVGAMPYRIGIVRDADAREAVVSNTLRVDAFVAAGSPGGGLGSLGGVGEVRTIDVSVHPGSQVAFGNVEGRPFFWVSDKPLGAFVSFELFVRPGLLRMMGRGDLKRPEVTAVLDEPVHGPSGVALFVPARMAHRDGAWHVRPTGPAEEGHLGSLAEANALLTVPPGGASGGEVRVRVLRPLER